MPLVLLSLSNVRRNITRSLTAVMGMAVAAAMLTGLTAMSAGYPVEAYQPYRSYLQGDIVVYSGKWSLAGADAGVPQGNRAAGIRWELTGAPETEFMDLATFHPGVAQDGHLRPSGVSIAPLEDTTLKRIGETEGVSSVHAVRVLPCLVQSGTGDTAVFTVTRLRGRDDVADAAYRFREYVVAGRYFASEDAGKNVALVVTPKGLEIGYAGTTVRVLIPRAAGSGYDYSALTPVSLSIVGQVAVPTETEIVTVPGSGDRPPVTRTIQKYWETLDLLVPDSTLEAIYTLAGGSGLPPVYQAGVSVTSMFDVRTVASRLATSFPETTAVTVPEQVERARWESGQPTVPVDLRKALLVLGYLAAGFLVMANMYVLVSQRLHELGVLRAIGASGTEIFSLVLFEMAGYSLCGAILGFSVVRAFFSGIMMLTDVGLLRGSLLTVTSLLQVIAATVGVSVIFGVGPALYAARASTAEVLRGNA